MNLTAGKGLEASDAWVLVILVGLFLIWLGMGGGKRG